MAKNTSTVQPTDSIKLLKVYVDDLNQVARCLPVGSRYIAGKLYVPGEGWKGRSPPGQAMSATRKKEIEQEADGQSREGSTRENQERNSAEVYRQIANEVLPRSIKMKEDVPANHRNGLLPILDTQMAIVDGMIVFHHYTKPMASKETILARSVMSLGSKLTS